MNIDMEQIVVALRPLFDAINAQFEHLRTELGEFKTEMREFKAEMSDFKTEMIEFKADTRAFQDEMLTFRAETRRNFQLVADHIDRRFDAVEGDLYATKNVLSRVSRDVAALKSVPKN